MLKICTLASGSSGNCTYVSDGETHVLIDAGISARAITNGLAAFGLNPSDISAILITHEHWDHIRGLEVLEKKNTIPIFAAQESTACSLCTQYPALAERVVPFETGVFFCVGGICVESFRTPHDTDHSVGYRIEAGGSTAVYLTDLGHVPREVREKIPGAQLVLLEANYDEGALASGPYPAMLKRRIAGANGHLSNSDCAECALFAAQSGAKYLVLGHLSKENNSPKLAYEAVHSRLTRSGFIPGVDIMLHVAPRSECGILYELEGVDPCAK